jgi:small-conductance mechanosensitive channel
MAQEAPADARSATDKVEEIVKLLDDPQVRALLEATTAAPAAPPASVSGRLAGWDDALQAHLSAMATALQRLPHELAGALGKLSSGQSGGIGPMALLLLGMAAAGFALEWLARRLLSAALAPNPAAPRDATSRALARLMPVLAFAAGSLLAFITFGGTPLLRKVALTYLVALIATRLVTAIATLSAGVLLSPPATEEPGDAVTKDDARFWRRRVVAFTAYLMFTWATLSLLPSLGFTEDVTHLLSYLAGIGLVVIAVATVWQMPGTTDGSGTARRVLLTLFIISLWFVWSAGLNIVLWLGIYALVLPSLLRVTGRLTDTLVQRANPDAPANIFRDVLTRQGLRAAIVLIAVLWLAFVLRVNPGVLAASDEFASRITRGVLHSIVILLLADLTWHVAKAFIDRALVIDTNGQSIQTTDAAPIGRLQTLLPIFRYTLAILIGTVAVLMVLAELGVEIGPLIAGAGIFGVAIGFGSQSLVKDIVSGIFYLIDDAFRVGEYIQSGSYKGTVEGFSIRSIRLRHHRGPVYTVPFGSLGAVQNLSRDWAIDKFMVRLPFDTDVRLVKRLAKKVGATLLEDEELSQYLLQTLKMKGIERFDDYGMEVSFAFMSKPGYQSTVRRQAYVMLRDTLKENGIDFAQPSVSIGGDEADEHGNTAAAATIVARDKAAKEAET